MTAELDAIVRVLDDLRDGVLDKLAGLSEEDARRSTVPSGTNLAGLVQHLTFVEAKWFEQIVGGGKPTRGKRTMTVDASTTLTDLRSAYRAASETSNEIARGIGDPGATVTVNGKKRDLREVMLGIIEEIARHLGHADIIREQIDGKTGR